MCPPVSGNRSSDSIFGDSPASPLSENLSRDNILSASLPPEIKEQIFDLPSFITQEQRNYVGEQFRGHPNKFIENIF